MGIVSSPHRISSVCALPRTDEGDQRFQIVEVVIIPHDAFLVINNARLFVAFQAVQGTVRVADAERADKTGTR